MSGSHRTGGTRDRSGHLETSEHTSDNGWVGRTYAIEDKPDVWAGGYDGQVVRHHGRPDIPVTVRVRWSDGTRATTTQRPPVDQVSRLCRFRRPAVDVGAGRRLAPSRSDLLSNDPHPGGRMRAASGTHPHGGEARAALGRTPLGDPRIIEPLLRHRAHSGLTVFSLATKARRPAVFLCAVDRQSPDVSAGGSCMRVER
jgi:hypothetical protein